MTRDWITRHRSSWFGSCLLKTKCDLGHLQASWYIHGNFPWRCGTELSYQLTPNKICPNAILNLYGLHGISTGFFHGIRSFMDLYGTELCCQLVPKFTFRRPTLSTQSRERTEGNILFFENEQQTRSILAQLILTIAPLFRHCHRVGYYGFCKRNEWISSNACKPY